MPRKVFVKHTPNGFQRFVVKDGKVVPLGHRRGGGVVAAEAAAPVEAAPRETKPQTIFDEINRRLADLKVVAPATARLGKGISTFA